MSFLEADGVGVSQMVTQDICYDQGHEMKELLMLTLSI